MPGPFLTGVLRWVRFFAFFYLVMLVLVTVFQRRLIYFPTRAGEEAVVAEARIAGLEPWRDGQGALIGFVARGREPGREPGLEPGKGGAQPRPPVLVTHGNAGYAAHRAYMVALFPDHDVYILEYPGYGARPGRPRESSMRAAAAEALRELRTGPPGSAVILAGESIGSGPAAWLAGRYPEAVAGVVLITPFASLVDVAAAQFPILPVRWLLRDRWDNRRNLAGYPGPVAIVVAAEDAVVPPRFAHALYEDYSGTARLWTVADAGHNSVMRVLSGAAGREIRREVTRFLADSAPVPPGSPRD